MSIMTEDWETRVQYNNIHKWLIIWQNTFEWFLYFISNFQHACHNDNYLENTGSRIDMQTHAANGRR